MILYVFYSIFLYHCYIKNIFFLYCRFWLVIFCCLITFRFQYIDKWHLHCYHTKLSVDQYSTNKFICFLNKYIIILKQARALRSNTISNYLFVSASFIKAWVIVSWFNLCFREIWITTIDIWNIFFLLWTNWRAKTIFSIKCNIYDAMMTGRG